MNRVFNENCLDTMDRFPANFIDLTVTSPPYDKLRDYKGYCFDFEPIANDLYRVTKKNGVVVWVVNDATIKGSESGTSFRQALYFMSLGFSLHDTMIYKKSSAPLNHNRYEQDFEFMFVFSKGKPKTFNPIKIPCIWFGHDSDRTGQKMGLHGEKMKRVRSLKDRTNIKPDKIKGNIWEYNTGYNHSTKDKIAFEHPAIFPESLAKDHILTWSDPGNLIYDPFAGSGTTLKMAALNGRNFIGSEMASEYIPIINARIGPVLSKARFL